MTKKEYEEYKEETNRQKVRELEYKKKVLLNRKKGVNPITKELVIEGVKFIVEHQYLEQDELIDGLLDLGCNFNHKDILKQYPDANNCTLLEGIKKGLVSTGAATIVNTRDSEFGRHYCNSALLQFDDNESLYHYIRVLTKDNTYTKENAKVLNINNKLK